MASFSKDHNYLNSPSPSRRAQSLESLLKPDMEELSCALERFHNENSRDISSPCRRYSESSIEISIVTDSDDDTSGDTNCVLKLRDTADSGVCDRSCASGDALQVLEQKIEFLNEVFAEQRKLLSSLRHEVDNTSQMVNEAVGEQTKITLDVIELAILQRFDSLRDGTSSTLSQGSQAGRDATVGINSRAKALLDALEAKQKIQETSIDAIIKSALNEFLHSDAFQDEMLIATTTSVNQVIKESFTRDLMTKYMPLLQQSHRQLMKQVSRILDDTLKEMEVNTLSLSRSSYKSSKQIRNALQSHQRLLNAFEPHQDVIKTTNTTVKGILERELADWHTKVTEMFTGLTAPESVQTDYVPSSPPQPAQPGRSAIELLMKAAEINEQMKEDVNGSFEKALSASDLSLVMAACRAADPAVIFSPCRLQQPVLLSLLQQLATDMVHDTQLKCRYMEEALINLDISDATTRTHVPVVIKEMINNLKTFILTYPSHMSSRRIKMLIMAANSLVKTLLK